MGSARVPRLSSIVYACIPDPQSLAQRVLNADFAEPLRLLKQTPTSSVASAESEHDPIIIKTHALTRPLDSLALWLRRSQLCRELRASRLLAARGIPANHCLALFTHRAADGALTEVLIQKRVPGDTLLRHIARRDIPNGDAQLLAHRLGSLVRDTLYAGLFNRDPKPSNIIITNVRDDPKPVFIDTIGVRALRPWERSPAAQSKLLARMLASLIIEPMGVCPKALPAPRLRAIAIRAAEPIALRRAHLYRMIRQIVRDHGDPTPRHNPLA